MRIAITGGIGSGKSTVAKWIAEQGYKVLSCDEIYKRLWDGHVFDGELHRIFGQAIFKDGAPDRKKLAEIVFGDDEKLARLNDLTHPVIINQMLKESDNCQGLCFVEIQLLFEGNYKSCFDKIIVVKRALRDRIQSIKQRNGFTEDEILKRISSQVNYDSLDLSDCYVIENKGTFDDLRKKTLTVVEELKRLSAQE